MVNRIVYGALAGFIICAISSCTTYTKNGYFGGFDETRLGKDIWRVDARGNKYASSALIANMVMLRSADLATQNGFSYFAFASGSTASKTSLHHFGKRLTFYSKPEAENTVIMFKRKPADFKGLIYEASFICESLGTKLGATCGEIK